MQTTKTTTAKFDRSKVRVVMTANGGANITDTNNGSRCTASVLKMAHGKWNVRIDKNGVDGWKYAAGIPAANPEAAYEYCLIYGERVSDDA
jgi:hypothetical protein